MSLNNDFIFINIFSQLKNPISPKYNIFTKATPDFHFYNSVLPCF